GRPGVARLARGRLGGCAGPDVTVFRSELPRARLPADPRGRWMCITETVHGQLVGLRRFEVVGPDGRTAPGDDDGLGSAAPARDGGVAGRPRDRGATDGGA